MLDTDLRERIVESMYPLLPKVLQREVPDASESTRLMEDLGLTSSTTLELMLELEESLGIEINVEDIGEDDVTTLGALADFIATHQLTGDE
jgi:acyl carrier protein